MLFLEVIRTDTDSSGEITPADTPTVRQLVYGGQAGWQLIAEFAGVQPSSPPLAWHVYGQYIDDLVRTERFDDPTGVFAGSREPA